MARNQETLATILSFERIKAFVRLTRDVALEAVHEYFRPLAQFVGIAFRRRPPASTAPIPPLFHVAPREISDSAPQVKIGHSWYLPLKSGFDVVLALALLVVLAPVVLVCVILIKLTSRGPALYRQVVVGKDGRPFTLLKLRTMRNNAEAETGPVWSIENDVRVTPLGEILRRTQIDEFPQLFNVVRGEMSLVGPRPERPEFVANLEWEVPFYRERLKLRPGITGLSQLSLPSDASLECVRRKVVMDVYYIRHINPALDIKILIVAGWRLFWEFILAMVRFLKLPNYADAERGFRRTVGMASDESQVTHIPLTSEFGQTENPKTQAPLPMPSGNVH
jgi:lipopolysaccharide/colanic/teichoic acid biosynthesis glycosyltransferase